VRVYGLLYLVNCALDIRKKQTKKASSIEFPSDFPIKIMGEIHDTFAQTILELVLLHDLILMQRKWKCGLPPKASTYRSP
jgi:hypothetical protein